MCRQLNVTQAGYYLYLKRGQSRHAKRDAELKEAIAAIHSRLDGNAGVRRVRAELVACGQPTSHKRTARLMQELGLAGRHVRAYRQTTVSSGDGGSIPDLIRRDFSATEPNRKWVGDITYIRTSAGFKYLATVIDLYSRKVIGWAVAGHMRTDLVIRALMMALRDRKPKDSVIFHSDRGSQYTSLEFGSFCTRHGVTQSMGRVGSCYDNAVAESFFASLKKELIHCRPWMSLADLKKGIYHFIEFTYNSRRRHSYLGYLTPAEYELGYRSLYELAA